MNNTSVVAKRSRPSAPANSLPKTPKFYNESPLVGVDEPIDFGLDDWLSKANAGKHFERGGHQMRFA